MLTKNEENEILQSYDLQNKRIKIIYKPLSIGTGAMVNLQPSIRDILPFLLRKLFYFFIYVLSFLTIIYGIDLLIYSISNSKYVILLIAVYIIILCGIIIVVKLIEVAVLVHQLLRYKYGGNYDFLIYIDSCVGAFIKDKDDLNLYIKYLLSHECKHIENILKKEYDVTESWIDYFAMKKLNIDPMKLWSIDKQYTKKLFE